MKKNKIKDLFLGELRKVPIVQVACEKVSVSRNSVYRWRNEDVKFKEEMEMAMAEGEAFINDMCESQLISLIKNKEFKAISLFLRHRNPKYKEKVEVTAKIENSKEPLSPEQEELIKKALVLAMPQKTNEESKL